MQNQNLSCLMVLVGALLYGCASNRVPEEFNPHFQDDDITIKFEDNWWVLKKDLIFFIGKPDPVTKSQPFARVPAGFVTNLTSFEPIRDHPVYNKAAIIHDYLYWIHLCGDSNASKSLSDKLYLQALKSSGASRLTARALKEAVAKWHKSGPWDNNYDRRLKGESRFIPIEREEYWSDIPNLTWEKFQEKHHLDQIEIEKTDRVLDLSPVCKIFPKFNIE